MIELTAALMAMQGSTAALVAQMRQQQVQQAMQISQAAIERVTGVGTVQIGTASTHRCAYCATKQTGAVHCASCGAPQ